MGLFQNLSLFSLRVTDESSRNALFTRKEVYVFSEDILTDYKTNLLRKQNVYLPLLLEKICYRYFTWWIIKENHCGISWDRERKVSEAPIMLHIGKSLQTLGWKKWHSRADVNHSKLLNLFYFIIRIQKRRAVTWAASWLCTDTQVLIYVNKHDVNKAESSVMRALRSGYKEDQVDLSPR